MQSRWSISSFAVELLDVKRLSSWRFHHFYLWFGKINMSILIINPLEQLMNGRTEALVGILLPRRTPVHNCRAFVHRHSVVHYAQIHTPQPHTGFLITLLYSLWFELGTENCTWDNLLCVVMAIDDKKNYYVADGATARVRIDGCVSKRYCV